LKNFFIWVALYKRGSPFLVVNGKYLLFIAIIIDNHIQSLKSQFRLFPFAFLADCAPIGAWFFNYFRRHSALHCAIDFSLTG
jgi:hypothetical protein